ncbi:MAG: DUF3754 domain-containing protein [Phycisphaerales bacterium JB039]
MNVEGEGAGYLAALVPWPAMLRSAPQAPASMAAPDLGAGARAPDDRFIPVEAHDLIGALVARPAAPEPLEGLLGLIEDIMHQEATALERHVVRLYALVNPDRETVRRASPAAMEAAHERVEACVWRLLEKANFQRLSEVEIEQAIRTANSHGLRIRVRPDMVERLAVWIRGPDTRAARRRTWRAPVRGEPACVPIYRRLVLMARLRGSTDVILKMFRDIPVAVLEALLPHATVGMSWLDRAIIFGGGAGGFGPIVVKLATGAAIVGASRVIAIAAGLMMIRSFFGYRRTRFRRDSQRTRSLYFQNMANNAAVIHRFVSMIAEEEIKEAALGCALLWDRGVRAEAIASVADLKSAAERFVRDEFGARISFDVADAIETIDRLSLWADRDALQLVTPMIAQQALLDHRASRRSWSYHLDSLGRAGPLAPEAADRLSRTGAAAHDPAI